MHVGKAGDAGPQHFGDGERSPVAHVFRVDPAALERPHRGAQPAAERQVLGPAAQQHHGRVRVGVDEPGQQHVVRPLNDLGRFVPGARLMGREHCDDPATADRDRVILEDGAGGLHRNHPARGDERVDGVHA